MEKKVALVTGASRGIGAAIAARMVREGYCVAMHYGNSKKQAEALAATLPHAMTVQADMGDAAAVEKMISEVIRHYGRIDVLINNAGIALYKLLMDTSVQEWDRLFDVNVRGMFLACKYALPQMLTQGSGCIINISSMWGQVGASMETAYSASKAAVIGLTKALAKEMGGAGIRVNCISPGVIDTDMMKSFNEADRCRLADETPLDRIGSPEDIAAAAAFLAGDGGAFITGQVLAVNGGFVID